MTDCMKSIGLTVITSISNCCKFRVRLTHSVVVSNETQIAVTVHGDGIVIVVLVDIWWITGEYHFSRRLAELATVLEHHTIQS